MIGTFWITFCKTYLRITVRGLAPRRRPGGSLLHDPDAVCTLVLSEGVGGDERGEEREEDEDKGDEDADPHDHFRHARGLAHGRPHPAEGARPKRPGSRRHRFRADRR